VVKSLGETRISLATNGTCCHLVAQDGPQWCECCFRTPMKSIVLYSYIYHKPSFFSQLISQLNAILAAPSCQYNQDNQLISQHFAPAMLHWGADMLRNWAGSVEVLRCLTRIPCPPKTCRSNLPWSLRNRMEGISVLSHCPPHRTPAFRYGKSACIKICMAKHDPIHIHSPVVVDSWETFQPQPLGGCFTSWHC